MTRKEVRDLIDRKTHFQFSKELDELFNYKKAFEEMISRSADYSIDWTQNNDVYVVSNTNEDVPMLCFQFNDKGELK